LSKTTKEDDLEYNDGLGDLLREKDKLEFSWAKTSIVLIAIIFVIFVGLTFLVKLGKSMLTEKPMDFTEEPIMTETTFDVEAIEIEEANKQLIKFIEKDIKVAGTTQNAPTKTKTTKPTTPLPYKIIVGSYKNVTFAKKFQAELKTKKINAFIWKSEVNGVLYYKIQAGAFPSRDSGKAFIKKLETKGISGYILKK
jgi:cell division protein FtsN